MRTRLSLRVGVVAVTAALLAACGGADGDGSGNGSGGNGSGDVGEPQVGGSLHILQQAEPRTLDPAIMTNGTSNDTLVGNSLYGQLLTVDEGGEVEYGLAESLESSDGGATWQLTLREDLTFSDGTPFDAAAVQFNWERIADPQTGSSGQGTAAFVASMTPSGQTLEFTLTTPVAQFESAIAAQQLNWIASPEALQAGPQVFDTNPIGAGPFVLESWQRQGQMVLVRNDNSFDSPRPYLDQLILSANGDAEQRYSTLVAGGADASTMSNPDIFARAVDEGLNGITQDLGGGAAIQMNTRIAPFDDQRARTAFFQAVDREAVNAVGYGAAGEVPETLFPEGSPFNGDTTLPEHDPAAAQALFDELAAEGKPFAATITAFQVTQARRVGENIQAQLNQYDNVAVQLEVLDFPAALSKLAQRTFEGMIGGIHFNHPQFTLYNSLHSSSASNSTGISDPELDAALEAALGAADEESRIQTLQEVGALYSELLPEMTYVRQEYALIYADHVQGVQMYGVGAARTDTMWTTE